jgi:hypothetical protein
MATFTIPAFAPAARAPRAPTGFTTGFGGIARGLPRRTAKKLIRDRIKAAEVVLKRNRYTNPELKHIKQSITNQVGGALVVNIPDHTVSFRTKTINEAIANHLESLVNGNVAPTRPSRSGTGGRGVAALATYRAEVKAGRLPIPTHPTTGRAVGYTPADVAAALAAQARNGVNLNPAGITPPAPRRVPTGRPRGRPRTPGPGLGGFSLSRAVRTGGSGGSGRGRGVAAAALDPRGTFGLPPTVPGGGPGPVFPPFQF